ncbi:hypothetical protein EJ04DRAFT_568786 [Polyplosphaeria fusca]|uniref:Uncharacterized protein n=1 Tax=Polyplosphaeria fusca TaxID=682080 RepID=A0A9P4UUU8_9PLEO|nr:hypothetical protein EJ04DRAFT_568786 [Polyplosphaeria fusca]
MSREYEDQDPLTLAKQAEKGMHSATNLKGHGKGASDSTLESGVDESVRNNFPGADVTCGSAASGAGDNGEIPLNEGGDVDPRTGKLYKAKDFEGVGGPEDKNKIYAEEQGGNDDVRGNVR